MHEGYERYREGSVRAAYQWCKEIGPVDANTPEGALNWIAAYSESASSRYFGSYTFEQTGNPIESAIVIANSIKTPTDADWPHGWSANKPYGFGNASLYDTKNLQMAINLGMIAWMSEGGGDPSIVPTGCGSYLLHDEKVNYERVGCGNGTWPFHQ